jgi:hypothetical protein
MYLHYWSNLVCLFVFTRPAGTRDRLLLKSVPLPHCILVQNVHVIIISAGTITRSSRFGPESTRGPIIATRHPASQAQGKRSPHDLPDLLSGRGLTHEGPCLKKCKNVKLKNILWRPSIPKSLLIVCMIICLLLAIPTNGIINQSIRTIFQLNWADIKLIVLKEPNGQEPRAQAGLQ